MTGIETIDAVLASGVLNGNLVVLPPNGATSEELAAAEQELGRPLSDTHRAILRRWNGIDLDVIRLYGVGVVVPGIRPLVAAQLNWETLPGLVIGSDPAGFVYLEGADGQALVYDTDGGGVKAVASDLDELFSRYVFGCNAATFGGAEWLAELQRAGLGRA